MAKQALDWSNGSISDLEEKDQLNFMAMVEAKKVFEEGMQRYAKPGCKVVFSYKGEDRFGAAQVELPKAKAKLSEWLKNAQANGVRT